MPFYREEIPGIYGTGYYLKTEIGGLQYWQKPKKKVGYRLGKDLACVTVASFAIRCCPEQYWIIIFSINPFCWPDISIQEYQVTEGIMGVAFQVRFMIPEL